MTYSEYYHLVSLGLESLRKNLNEAIMFTQESYNQAIQKEQAPIETTETKKETKSKEK